MICIREKCHSLAFHLKKDLIIIAKFRLFQKQKTFPAMFLDSWLCCRCLHNSAVAYPEANIAERGGTVCVTSTGVGLTS